MIQTIPVPGCPLYVVIVGGPTPTCPLESSAVCASRLKTGTPVLVKPRPYVYVGEPTGVT